LEDTPTGFIERLKASFDVLEFYREYGLLNHYEANHAKECQWVLRQQLISIDQYRRRFQRCKPMGGEPLGSVLRRAKSGSWQDTVRLVQWDARWLFEPWLRDRVICLSATGDPEGRLAEIGRVLPKNAWFRRGTRPELVRRVKRLLQMANCQTVPELLSRAKAARRRRRARGLKGNVLWRTFPASYNQLLELMITFPGGVDENLYDMANFKKLLQRNGLA